MIRKVYSKEENLFINVISYALKVIESIPMILHFNTSSDERNVSSENLIL